MFGLTDKTMNNRQLKFRIWDKHYKKWIENSNSLHCYSNWTICPFTGNLVDYVGAFDGDHGDFFTASPAADCYLEGGKVVRESRYVIQQYTGLKDKNGTPIFEGDIIRLTLNSDYIWTGIVQWDKYMGLKLNDGGWTSMVHVDIGGEVLGNIFENPELLKIND